MRTGKYTLFICEIIPCIPNEDNSTSALGWAVGWEEHYYTAELHPNSYYKCVFYYKTGMNREEAIICFNEYKRQKENELELKNATSEDAIFINQKECQLFEQKLKETERNN